MYVDNLAQVPVWSLASDGNHDIWDIWVLIVRYALITSLS